MSLTRTPAPRGSALAIGATAALFVIALWSGIALPSAAQAQVPDSGKQRLDMIKELRTTNQKLTEAVKLLAEIRDLQKAQAARGEGD